MKAVNHRRDRCNCSRRTVTDVPPGMVVLPGGAGSARVLCFGAEDRRILPLRVG